MKQAAHPLLEEINIRTELRPGDMGYIIHLHGRMYHQENHYGMQFESYVAAGLHEFYSRYDANLDRVWICEHQERIVGFLLLMHRPAHQAQLRYFLLLPEYRGMGLGTLLMRLFMEQFLALKYEGSYLWTTREQEAAIALYRKFGYHLTEEKPSDGFGKSLIEQRYELTRPAAVA